LTTKSRSGIIKTVKEREEMKMLKISNRVEIKGFLRVEDLEAGQLFTFLDEDSVFMKTDDNSQFVNLETGILHEYYDSKHEDRPVRKIYGELKIIK
jgi:hypothetical protein